MNDYAIGAIIAVAFGSLYAAWMIFKLKRVKAKKLNGPLPNESIRFINATYAVTTQNKGIGYNLFDKEDCFFFTKSTARRVLDSSWEIKNRENALDLIMTLSAGEMHNTAFLQEMQNPAHADAIDTQGMEAGSALHKHLVSAYRTLGDKAVLAWDMGRAVYLLNCCYVAGFLTKQEALERSIDICKHIQQRFESWDEYYTSWLNGYLYWSEDDPTHEAAEYQKRIKVLELLKNDPRSPLGVAWNTQLKVEE